ncbi:P-loop containing nucleoside triphosphate hydrolase protein [Chaetomium tenue]|uniref:P-loop containing nucleoside triphosphate hydrolase protein n=1 Tax=Chaetomium tenue TaxID=1854479 RepID=A0ACB7P8S5_9PEZI|nr:P-loop containing nucleoside triphosphate hydrolase protein [Chaetomium globosum]
MTLACIAGNPPTEEDEKNGRRITLVIKSTNIISDKISACHYRKSDIIHETARDYSSIWVTSYEEVSLHYPSDNKLKKYTGNKLLTPEECGELRGNHLGPLFKTAFYRIILDEAHGIKNYKSQLMVDLSREETLIYRRVEGILRTRGSKARAKSGFIEVLRLRQAVFHPFLLETLMKDVFESEDIKWLIKELSKVQTRNPFIDQIGLWCEEQLQVQTGSQGGQHEGLGASFDMISHLESVKQHSDWQKEVKSLCQRCGFVPDHAFRPEVSLRLTRSATKNSGCRRCNKLLSNIRKSLPSPQPPRSKDLAYGLGLPPKQSFSNPMLLKWCKLYPEDKIIVFTLFDADLDFLYYFGSMSHEEKYKGVKDFTEKKEIRVLALNLACANRVIILDVWWNSALEQQAFGRVYRMGQTKTTYFGRILVRNTIDVRLSHLQLAKLKTIARSIKEHDSSATELTAEDVASLLGRVVRDSDGNFVDIEADYDDESSIEAEDADWTNASDKSGGSVGEWDQETVMEAGSRSNLDDPESLE